MVIAEGSGDEPIVMRVVNSTEEDSVELEESTCLIDLILDFRSLGDLNDGIHYFRSF